MRESLTVSGKWRRATCLLAIACIALASSSCTSGHPPSATMKVQAGQTTYTLTQADRAEIFDFVWRTINEKYYDPSFHGVDWRAVGERYRPRMEAAPNDQEFYAQFELMLAELRDDHTRFFGPPPPALPGRQKDGDAPPSLGMTLGEVEGQTVVTEVEADSGAARAGIRPGMLLRAVNGRPIEEIYREIRTVFPGASSERSMKNTMHRALLYGWFMALPRTLVLVDEDGRELTVQPETMPAASSSGLEARRLASGSGYIKFDKWMPPADKRFNTELAKLMDTPGLIIDLRGNGGGQTDVLLNIASNFYAVPTYTGGFRTRAGTIDRYMTRAPGQLYKQPIVILIDELSASASETFTTFMQEHGRAYVVGRQSSGSTLNTKIHKVKGGGELRVSIRAYISPKGRNPEGTGVVPDKIVPLTLADLRQGRDAALETAEAYLRERQRR